jgi:hypothetical protein
MISCRCLKKYPVWFRPLVREAVEGEWIPALHMVIEQEDYVKARKEQLAGKRECKWMAINWSADNSDLPRDELIEDGRG